jgi:hypothetical protein
MLSVSLYYLCLWLVCRRPVYCVPNAVSVSVLSLSLQDDDKQTKDRDNTETLTALGTQYTGRRQTNQRQR